MSQTRTGSLVESLANIAIGFAINWAANMLILPLFGFNVTGRQAFGIGVFFTVISLVRSFALRRVFNRIKFGNKLGEPVGPPRPLRMVRHCPDKRLAENGMEHAP